MKRYIPIEKKELPQPIPQKEFTERDSARLKKYYHDKERYFSIDKNILLPDIKLIFSLYIQKNLNYEPLLEAVEGSSGKVTSEILEYKGDILIKESDIPAYKEYINSLNGESVNDLHIQRAKATLIKEKSKLIVKDILSSPENNNNIKKSGEAVEQIASSILSNKDIFYDLISIQNHDYYTYTHSVNVAVLSIGLGIVSGLSTSDTFNLGLGALLHDIGKCTISPEILNKLGRLTSIEYKIMKNHVIEGEKILKNLPYFPESSLSAVTQHHERLSGKGYPNNLTGAKISIYGKITAITDTYEYLTTERPNKNRLTPFEALSILVKECEHYDSDLLRTFIKLIGGIQE